MKHRVERHFQTAAQLLSQQRNGNLMSRLFTHIASNFGSAHDYTHHVDLVTTYVYIETTNYTTHVCMYMCMYVYICIHIYIFVCVWCIHTCVWYIDIHICIYIYTYMRLCRNDSTGHIDLFTTCLYKHTTKNTTDI